MKHIVHDPAEHPHGRTDDQSPTQHENDDGRQDEQSSHQKYGIEHGTDRNTQRPSQSNGEKHGRDAEQNDQQHENEQGIGQQRKILDQAQRDLFGHEHGIFAGILQRPFDPSGFVLVVFHDFRAIG